MITMHRISAGSRPVMNEFEEDGEDALKAFSGVMNPVMQLIHNAVEDYINDDSLTFDSSDNYQFPVRSQVAGEYYISRIIYGREAFGGQAAYWCSAMARCTGRIIPERAEVSDYLGLDVVIILPLADGVPRLYTVNSSAL